MILYQEVAFLAITNRAGSNGGAPLGGYARMGKGYMRTKRIQIEKNETVELYISQAKQRTSCRDEVGRAGDALPRSVEEMKYRIKP
jgi:hypothetical protein